MLEVKKDGFSLIQMPRVDFMLGACFIKCAAMPQALQLMSESPIYTHALIYIWLKRKTHVYSQMYLEYQYKKKYIS